MQVYFSWRLSIAHSDKPLYPKRNRMTACLKDPA
jgi:hypothetical protein